MALVKCPECGRECVSDNAEMCPSCGYGIKVHFERVKQEEELKRRKEEEELERKEREEKLRKIQEMQEQRKKEYKRKLFGSTPKKILWIIMILCIVIVSGIFIARNKEIKDAKYRIEKINQYSKEVDDELKNASFVYGSAQSDVMIDKVSDDILMLSVYVDLTNSSYKKGNKISEEIDAYIKGNTNKDSWEKFEFYITERYRLNETPDEAADKLVKKVAYSSNDELITAKRKEAQEKEEEYKKSNVHVSEHDFYISGGDIKIYGSVLNNTTNTVRFVKVKISLIDEEGNVVDTASTYACGDEGLKPGESSTFEWYMDYSSKIKSYSVEVFDYN